MKLSIRPTAPEDAPAIAALFAESGLRTNLDPRYLGWKYWQPRAEWPGSRSFVAASGGEVLAHAAILPGAWTGGMRRATIMHMIDWAARPGSGAGVTLLKYLGRMTQALLAIGGGPDTRRILPHVGFRPVGAATAFARPLFPLRVLRAGATWRALPRLARAAWRRSALVVPDADWRARRLAGDEVGHITAVLPRPAPGMAVTERSVELFRYVLSCPTVAMRLYSVEQAGSVRGYFLLAPVAGQVRIADCWTDSPDPADWRAMIFCSVEQAQNDPQAAEIVAWASDPLLGSALRDCGFYARSHSPIQMRPGGDDTLPEGTLRVQMLDNDAAYLYGGRNEYWG